MVKEKCGAVEYSERLRTLTAAGRLAPGRAQNLTCQVAFLMAVAVKSAFALLSTKVTKPVPYPALKDTDKKRCEVVFIGEND